MTGGTTRLAITIAIALICTAAAATPLPVTYREVVRPEEAERYWKIEPTSETANVVAFSATA
jgi:hypothetical protein